MCLIVDVNVATRIIDGTDPDFQPVRCALYGDKHPTARMVYGGKLSKEYAANRKLFQAILQLDRAGRARRVPDADVNAICDRLEAQGACTSDDAHIIALALVANVRLLCSADAALIADFTSSKLLSAPRGKVYRNPTHKRLLSRFCKGRVGQGTK